MNRLALIGIMSGIAILIVVIKFDAPVVIDPLPESKVELTKILDGVTHKLDRDGHLYRVNEKGKWVYQETLFEPAKMRAAFEEKEGNIYRVDRDDGRRFLTVRKLSEDFENLPEGRAGLRALIGPNRGWGSITLQSPKAPEVKDYMKLQKEIFAGKADFLDAEVAPNRKRLHQGLQALQCVAPARGRGMTTCKASLTSPLLYFQLGDHFWYRAFYYAEGALPTTIMDLECPWLKGHGGIRLAIDQSGHLMAELKALDKPKYQQVQESAVVFPLDQWVEVKLHLKLSHKDEGVIQIWQDGKQIVDTTGVTLPLSRAIYSSLEVGISAHSYGDKSSTLWVDDIEVSDVRL